MTRLDDFQIRIYCVLDVCHQTLCELLKILSLQHEAVKSSDPNIALATIFKLDVSARKLIESHVSQMMYQDNKIFSENEIFIDDLDIPMLCSILSSVDFPTKQDRCQQPCLETHYLGNCCTDCEHLRHICKKKKCQICKKFKSSNKYSEIQGAIKLMKMIQHAFAHSTTAELENFLNGTLVLPGFPFCTDWRSLWTIINQCIKDCKVYICNSNVSSKSCKKLENIMSTMQLLLEKHDLAETFQMNISKQMQFLKHELEECKGDVKSLTEIFRRRSRNEDVKANSIMFAQKIASNGKHFTVGSFRLISTNPCQGLSEKILQTFTSC